VADLPAECWTALPDRAAEAALVGAARSFWSVPAGLDILPVPGASAAIARIPALTPAGRVQIPAPTYNEHAAAFAAAGWTLAENDQPANATVLVHPNNPDGRLWHARDLPGAGLLVIDESFCDIAPTDSLLGSTADRPDTLCLKSFGKFWGLAGLRLGFVIGPTPLIDRLRDMTGPWAVSGPALTIGTQALGDAGWAAATRARLTAEAERLDRIFAPHATGRPAGTTLFRLYDVGDADALQDRLARQRILTRRFPYSDRWLRVGLPGSEIGWQRVTDALA
jgi:cobalamin biosynthetic protein CobC